MPFCPVCKSEYREGFTHCFHCDADLIDSLPPELQTESPKAVKTQEFEKDEPVLLVCGTSTVDCGAIEGALTSAGIPYLRHERETGGYMRVYMGYSVYGADFYVPGSLLEKAREALDAACISGADEQVTPVEPDGEVTEADERAEAGYALKKQLIAIFLLLMLFQGVAVAVVLWIINLTFNH